MRDSGSLHLREPVEVGVKEPTKSSDLRLFPTGREYDFKFAKIYGFED
jgi:hypothetical protein